MEKAAADEFLRPAEKQCEQFREAVRRVWAAKMKDKDSIRPAEEIYKGKPPRWAITHKGRLIKPSSIIDKAVRPPFRLDNELALALFARAVKAGIMPLCHVTYGVKYYDLRYYADHDRLSEFLQMTPEGLLSVLCPAEKNAAAGKAESAASAPAAHVQSDLQLSAAAADSALAVNQAAANGDEAYPRRPFPARSGRGRYADFGFAEGAAAPLLPAIKNPPFAEDDSADDTELFTTPKSAHALGTLKHKAVADKLRAELLLIFPSQAGTIYRFQDSVKFHYDEEFQWGKFEDDEVLYVNQVLADLQNADSVLVEYNLPAKQGMFKQAKQIDVVAYYSRARTLKIIDWKFGSVPVGIDNNAQLNSYVQRLLHDFMQGNTGSVEWIEISIVQPNSHIGETKRKFLNKNGHLR